jgi:hypothetical protein
MGDPRMMLIEEPIRRISKLEKAILYMYVSPERIVSGECVDINVMKARPATKSLLKLLWNNA